ncbi:AraC-like DNA-binding protein [Paenibacillus endophyticus]|uniref:AraC-like DNA-binding protein n=1 Tax=Paenibacillus endophyticus TaxID=1294268 RepID=A0A7W5CCP0_9BACL|nr:AraC family transcriptional regulator [Paenibacillus endophyticus]MBB3154785.1 AraC-like DNA-binding protein [Paenibacillus endophyticus]
MSASLDFFYQESRAKHEYIALHNHQSYELVYYVSGQGTTRIGHSDYAFKAGDYAIIAPRTLHDERHEVLAKVLFAGFSSRLYPSLTEGIYQDTPARLVFTQMHAMACELRDKQPYYKQMLDSRISHLYLELLRAQPAQEIDSRINIIQFAKTYIDEYYMHKIDFQALADQSGYSYDRFRHLFKLKVGSSPSQYILQRRLEQAKSMLQHTRLQISAIAMECGFSTDAQFCSLFKRETRMTPKSYREQITADGL